MHHILSWCILLDQDMETSSSYLAHTFCTKRTWRNGLQWQKYSPRNLGYSPFEFNFFPFDLLFNFDPICPSFGQHHTNVPTNVIKGGFCISFFFPSPKNSLKNQPFHLESWCSAHYFAKMKKIKEGLTCTHHINSLFSQKNTRFLPPLKNCNTSIVNTWTLWVSSFP